MFAVSWDPEHIRNGFFAFVSYPENLGYQVFYLFVILEILEREVPNILRVPGNISQTQNPTHIQINADGSGPRGRAGSLKATHWRAAPPRPQLGFFRAVRDPA